MFIGCSTVQPVTPRIVNDVGAHRMHEFQYYISKPVTFTGVDREASRRSVDITDTGMTRGQLRGSGHIERRVVNVTTRPNIFMRLFFPHRGMGIVNTYSITGDRIDLNTSFGPTGVESQLQFAEVTGERNALFYLVLTLPSQRVEMHDGINYNVSWEGSALPHLLIKGRIKQTERTRTRTAPGMRVGK